MPRPSSIQWEYERYLSDNQVLAMDWDARGMHMHLLMLSIQEEPPGTIPADDAAIRRWLSLPPGSVDSDQTWRRVKPQLLAAWQPEGERLANPGMLKTFERRERYRQRYETGTKQERKNSENCLYKGLKDLDLEVQDQNLKPSTKRKPRSGIRIPDGYKVSDEMREFSRVNHLPDPDLHIAEFIDYWTAQSGQKAVKSDWDATFRNWLRRAPNFQQGKGNGKLSFEDRAAKEREIARAYSARNGS